MKISLVTELFYPNIGGQEFRFYQLAKVLARKNNEVTVYTSDHTNGMLPSEEHLEGFTVIRYIKLKNYVKPGSRSISPLLKYVKSTHQLMKQLIEDNDVIIVNEMPIIHLFALPREKKVKKKVVVDWCEYYDQGYRKIILDIAVKHLCYSTAVSEIIARRANRANPRLIVKVIRTPLQVKKYESTYDKKHKDLILYVGRLVPHKNVINLAKAVVILNLFMNIKMQLVIVGDGPLRNIIENMFSRYSFIKILGYVDEETKINLLKKAWLLAIPSLREGLPNIVAEAIASTTPILTVNSPLNDVAEFVKNT